MPCSKCHFRSTKPTTAHAAALHPSNPHAHTGRLRTAELELDAAALNAGYDRWIGMAVPDSARPATRRAAAAAAAAAAGGGGQQRGGAGAGQPPPVSSQVQPMESGGDGGDQSLAAVIER